MISRTTILHSALAAALMTYALDARAATRTWSGATNTDWNTAANWGGTVPTSADIAAIPNTANQPSITANNAVSTNTRVGSTATVTSLGISGAGVLTDTNGYVGYAAGSTATAAVTGASAQWINSNNFFVGNNGTGTLNVQNGGSVSMGTGGVGNTSGSNGTITVTGTGSNLTSTNFFNVGIAGTGTLTISNSGQVTSVNGRIGQSAGGVGTVTVTDAGSQWINTGASLLIGNLGTGALSVLNGGSISAVNGYLAGTSSAAGSASVSGVGSNWTNSADFYLGKIGTGTLTLSDSGSIVTGSGTAYTYTNPNGSTTAKTSTSTVYIAAESGSVGTLNIGSGSGVAPGTVSAATVAFGSGTGTINFNHSSSSYDFAPAITGTGTINAVAGTTNITSTLAGFTGTVNTTGGVFNYAYSGGGTFSATLTGTGGFSVSSASPLFISGTNASTFAGTTTVNSGSTLSVNGTLGGGVNVASGGTLKGNGTVGTVTAASGGIVAPGNSIGTLTVSSYTSNVGSIYQAEVERDGTSDLIHVSGTATLNGGTVSLIPYSGIYRTGFNYTILTADSGVSGTFTGSALSQGSLFLTPTLSYDFTHVYASIARNGVSFASVASTPNERATARALDSMSNGAMVHDAVASQGTVDTARTAYNQLSGEAHASVRNALLDSQHLVSNVLLDRLSSIGNGDRNAPQQIAAAGNDMRGMIPADRPSSAWIKGFGDWGQTNATSNVASISKNTSGVLMGTDGTLDDHWQGGAALGYSVTDMDADARSSHASSKNYHAALYAGTRPALYHTTVRIGSSLTWHDIDSTRHVNMAGINDTDMADYNAYTVQMFGELSYPLGLTRTSSIAPYGRINYTYQANSSFTESGGASALSVHSSDNALVSGTLGLRGAKDLFIADSNGPGVTHANLRGSAGWQYTGGDLNPSSSANFAAGSGSFTVDGAPVARNAFVYDASATIDLDHNASLGITYAGQFANEAQEQSIRGEFTYRF